MGTITSVCFESSPKTLKTKKTPKKHSPVGGSSVQKNREFNTLNPEELTNSSLSNNSQKEHCEISPLGDSPSKILEVFTKKISLKDFEIESKLGEGSYGTVYKVSLKHRPKSMKSEKYAMKCIRLSDFYNKRIQESTMFEEFVLEKLNHPFLTKLKFAFKDSTRAYLVMECGVGGPVDSMIAFKTSDNSKKNYRAKAFKNLGQQGVRFIAANVILGIQELHKHNIMYRDLKPQNIIIFEDGYTKLTDFGLSKFLTPSEVTNTEAGTVYYFAPEMVTRGYYTRAIDLWALGVFLFELATSESPFKPQQILQRNKFQSLAKRSQQSRDWKGHVLSSELKDLINKLLKYCPQERLGFNGFQDLKSHPFFKDIDWNRMMRKQLISPLLPIIKEFPIKVKQFKKSVFFEKMKEDWGQSDEQ